MKIQTVNKPVLPTRSLLLLLLMSLPFAVAAENAWITDSVTVDIHSLQDEDGLIITRLNSGTAVEIISKDGNYAHIRTEDDKTGWIKSIYLNNKKPISVEYLQLMGKFKTVSKDLEEAYARLGKYREMEKTAKAASFTKSELDKNVKQLKALGSELKVREAELATANTTIASLKAELQNNTAGDSGQSDPATTESASDAEENPSTSVLSIFSPEHKPFHVPFLWAIVAMLFSSVLAFIGGMKWLDYRIRKRHGGIRIY